MSNPLILCPLVASVMSSAVLSARLAYGIPVLCIDRRMLRKSFGWLYALGYSYVIHDFAILELLRS
ncbi:hypothetical protein DL544_18330 [Stenotrophomonas sp. pho]|nr:hypothetical protein DL544_18330 [Stenotrophomonas sp. pho]